MLDPVVKALLLQLAVDLDAEALGPLADRLEELEDGRAGEVREVARRPWERAAYQDWDERGSMTVTPGPVVWGPGHACRAALALFPEGPRWRARACYPNGQCETSVHATPADATESLFRRHGRAASTAVEGPLWPTPPGR